MTAPRSPEQRLMLAALTAVRLADADRLAERRLPEPPDAASRQLLNECCRALAGRFRRHHADVSEPPASHSRHLAAMLSMTYIASPTRRPTTTPSPCRCARTWPI